MKNLYVQYGCGLSAPQEWLNFDASPTLRLQKLPIVGSMLRSRLNVIFPANVRYGDIVKGLPVADNSCKGIYCSHVLEHLALEDFRKALRNTLRMLQPGGIFRCVVPDLEDAARNYLKALDRGHAMASLDFIGDQTLLGIKRRPRGIKGAATSFLGNSHHLWMWDGPSLMNELKQAGFGEVRACRFHDCQDSMFRKVEEEDRFYQAVALEARKHTVQTRTDLIPQHS